MSKIVSICMFRDFHVTRLDCKSNKNQPDRGLHNNVFIFPVQFGKLILSERGKETKRQKIFFGKCVYRDEKIRILKFKSCFKKLFAGQYYSEGM